MTIFLSLFALLALYVMAHLWWRTYKYTPKGFVSRYSINAQNLFIEQDCDPLDAQIYERRVRVNAPRNRRGEVLLMPLTVEEYRRVTMAPGHDYNSAVSDWFKNVHEFRADDRWQTEPLLKVRPLTDKERELTWPEALAHTVQREKEMDREDAEATAAYQHSAKEYERWSKDYKSGSFGAYHWWQ